MSPEVEFSIESLDMLKSISEFIDTKFGESTTDKFLANAYKTYDTFSKQPYIFKSAHFNENVKIGLINKTALFITRFKKVKSLFFSFGTRGFLIKNK